YFELTLFKLPGAVNINVPNVLDQRFLMASNSAKSSFTNSGSSLYKLLVSEGSSAKLYNWPTGSPTFGSTTTGIENPPEPLLSISFQSPFLKAKNPWEEW